MLPIEKLLGEAPSWSASYSPGGDTRQHLLNEVKLLQHAVHKYKLEFRALEIRITSDYLSIRDQLSVEEQSAVDSLTLLRSEIRKELSNMEDLLEARLRTIISGPPQEDMALPVDLASLRIIQQMIELLKEQVYHNNIATTVHNAQNPKAPLSDLSQDVDAHDQHTAPPNTQSLMHQLSLLQQQIEAQQVNTATVLNSQLKELRDTLVEEIRHSVYAETRQLRLQVQSAESQLSVIRHKVKSSTSSTNSGGASAGNAPIGSHKPAPSGVSQSTDAHSIHGNDPGDKNVVEVAENVKQVSGQSMSLKHEMEADDMTTVANDNQGSACNHHGNDIVNHGNIGEQENSATTKEVKTVVLGTEEMFV